ncbi:hypothetical protein ACKS0A_07720 [Histoplasma ohiense]
MFSIWSDSTPYRRRGKEEFCKQYVRSNFLIPQPYALSKGGYRYTPRRYIYIYIDLSSKGYLLPTIGGTTSARQACSGGWKRLAEASGAPATRSLCKRSVNHWLTSSGFSAQ